MYGGGLAVGGLEVCFVISLKAVWVDRSSRRWMASLRRVSGGVEDGDS